METNFVGLPVLAKGVLRGSVAGWKKDGEEGRGLLLQYNHGCAIYLPPENGGARGTCGLLELSRLFLKVTTRARALTCISECCRPRLFQKSRCRYLVRGVIVWRRTTRLGSVYVYHGGGEEDGVAPIAHHAATSNLRGKHLDAALPLIDWVLLHGEVAQSCIEKHEYCSTLWDAIRCLINVPAVEHRKPKA